MDIASSALNVATAIRRIFIHPVFAETLKYTEDGVATIKDLEVLFANAIRVVVALAGVALFLMFIAGGFSFLFAGGDQKKIEQAKGTLTNAIIGIVIIAVAYLLLRIISNFVGLNSILEFNIMIGK